MIITIKNIGYDLQKQDAAAVSCEVPDNLGMSGRICSAAAQILMRPGTRGGMLKPKVSHAERISPQSSIWAVYGPCGYGLTKLTCVQEC